jgi:hypothetical protein
MTDMPALNDQWDDIELAADPGHLALADPGVDAGDPSDPVQIRP